MSQGNGTPGDLGGADERARHRRSARLAREVEYERADRKRLERLLAVTLRVAVGDTTCDPLLLLEAIAAYTGDDLARPAFVVERERRDAKKRNELREAKRDASRERIRVRA